MRATKGGGVQKGAPKPQPRVLTVVKSPGNTRRGRARQPNTNASANGHAHMSSSGGGGGMRGGGRHPGGQNPTISAPGGNNTGRSVFRTHRWGAGALGPKDDKLNLAAPTQRLKDRFAKLQKGMPQAHARGRATAMVVDDAPPPGFVPHGGPNLNQHGLTLPY